MALNDMLTLIAVIFTFAGLLVNIVNTTFNITWKIAHERKDEDSKKANDRLHVPQPERSIRFFAIPDSSVRS